MCRRSEIIPAIQLTFSRWNDVFASFLNTLTEFLSSVCRYLPGDRILFQGLTFYMEVISSQVFVKRSNVIAGP